jgi:hypothetical protein
METEWKRSGNGMEAERKTLPIEMEMKRSGNGKNVNFMIFSTVPSVFPDLK